VQEANSGSQSDIVRKWSRKQEIATNLRRTIEKTEDKPNL
jgi:hypothetical protein